MNESPKSKANAMTHLTTARMTLAAAQKMLLRVALKLARPS
jgi:hypothetical protein